MILLTISLIKRHRLIFCTLRNIEKEPDTRPLIRLRIINLKTNMIMTQLGNTFQTCPFKSVVNVLNKHT